MRSTAISMFLSEQFYKKARQKCLVLISHKRAAAVTEQWFRKFLGTRTGTKGSILGLTEELP
jgi:hypothetical protein